MNENWEEEFNSIVQSMDLDDIKDPRFDKLTTEEVSRAILGMNETSTYLGRYLMQCIFDPSEELPEELAIYVRELVELTDTISTVLSACACPECLPEDCIDCTDEYMCEDCIRRLEEDN